MICMIRIRQLLAQGKSIVHRVDRDDTCLRSLRQCRQHARSDVQRRPHDELSSPPDRSRHNLAASGASDGVQDWDLLRTSGGSHAPCHRQHTLKTPSTHPQERQMGTYCTEYGCLLKVAVRGGGRGGGQGVAVVWAHSEQPPARLPGRGA